MSQLRLFDFNYPFQSNVAVTGSSEDSNFPASNMQKFFRSKVWRSSGHFVIDATNKKLDFSEGAGELTATLTSGTFTPTSLATEIKTQLEATGANTYTITFSTATGLWTIVSAGPTLSLLWLTGTNTATSVGPSLGYAVSDDTGALTYTGASIALHTEEFLQFDLKTTEAIDSFAVVFDPTIGVKFSEEATFTLEGNNSANWASPALSTALTLDNDASTITHFYTSDNNFRFWRLKIVDPKNPNLSVEISKVFLAKATQLSQTPEIGFTFQVNDNSSIDETEFHHRYTDIVPLRRGYDFNYKVLSETDRQVLFKVFERLGRVIPMAVALDPTETLFDKDLFLMYGYLEGNLGAAQQFITFFEAQLALIEAL